MMRWSLTGPLSVTMLLLVCCHPSKDDSAALDLDADGYSASVDCDDLDAFIHPGADERCNDQDDDCDGEIDEDAVDATLWFPDEDGDSYGDSVGTVTSCAQPTGHVSEATDCDDTDAAIYPGADERCNGKDDDCDGDVDEDAVGMASWFPDDDGDGYGDSRATPIVACTGPTGTVADDSDCNDRYDSIHPGADEVCDGVDNDCDGEIDEDAVDATLWYPDGDGDGYGNPMGVAVGACAAPTGTVDDDTDCDDAEFEINPGARDFCNDGVDQDCNGADKRCPYTGTLTASNASGVVLGIDEDVGLQSVMILDDIDGDGLDDLALGAPMATGNQTGVVYVFLGPVGSATRTVTDADATLSGEGPVHYTGKNLASAGDANGDGLSDFLVSAPYASDAGAYAGKVYLIPGSTDPSTLSLSGAWATFIGEGSGDQLGGGLAAGDVDADGVPDIVLGAVLADRVATDSGAAYLFWGGFSSGSHGCASADAIMPGTADSLAGKVAIGDLLGDGYGDIMVGALDSSLAFISGGAVEVYAGSELAEMGGTEPPPARATLTAACAWCGFGQSTGVGKDLDGDAIPDALVVDFDYPGVGTPPGAFYLFSGPLGSGTTSAIAADLRILGDGTNSSHVDQMAADGDINGDGAVDLVIASNCDEQASMNAGAIRIFYGPLTSGITSVLDADALVLGEAAYDYFGDDISTGGDLDGDGFDELVVLSASHDGGDGFYSQVYIYPGGAP